jgi:selenocysteine lyase/cysteine desulfurase
MNSRRDFLSAFGAASLAEVGRTSAFGASLQVGSSNARTPGEYLLSSGLVYLNTGSAGPTSRAVLERTVQAWTELETNPVVQAYGNDGVLAWTDGVRERVASFLGCSVEEVLITRSTSEGMNTVAQSIRLNAGDRVLTTDQEHEGGSDCWRYLAERRGIVVDTVAVPLDEHDASSVVKRFADAIRPATKVISVSHVLWTNGMRMPVAEISALARRHRILSIVDGAQAAGAIPVNVKAIGCHAYATTGHKWILGPKGTGMLYVSSDAGDAIKPIQWMGGKRVTSNSTGIGPIPIVVGLGAAVDAVAARGIPSIEAHNMALRDRAYRGLATIPKVRMVSQESGPLTTALVSFALPAEVDGRELLKVLREKHNIQVKAIDKTHFNGLRISPHVFNTERDVDALLGALRAELK